MLKNIVDEFGAPNSFWSSLAGCSEVMFEDWLNGKRSIPRSVARRFSRATGIETGTFLQKQETAFGLPKLWLRARSAGIGDKKRVLETISYARLLAENYWDLLNVLDKTVQNDPSELFSYIRSSVRSDSDPDDQGKVAANAFLVQTGLDQQQVGIGEVLRGHLRAQGIFVFEAPLGSHNPEGFCLQVGKQGSRKVCIFANTYATTWFHRNSVLLHELCHGIFDIEATEAEFDKSLFDDENPATDTPEARANSFAMHALVSDKLLGAYINRGYQPEKLDSRQLAELMAEIHAEPKLIIRAAKAHGMIDDQMAKELNTQVPSEGERKLASYHAKSLDELSEDEKSEFIKHRQAMNSWARNTVFPIRDMRLPLPFISDVLDALERSKISEGKAKELLLTRELSQFGIVSGMA